MIFEDNLRDNLDSEKSVFPVRSKTIGLKVYFLRPMCFLHNSTKLLSSDKNQSGSEISRKVSFTQYRCHRPLLNAAIFLSSWFVLFFTLIFQNIGKKLFGLYGRIYFFFRPSFAMLNTSKSWTEGFQSSIFNLRGSWHNY